MSSLVLIVDDESDLVQALEYNLHKEGYQTRTAGTAADALAKAALHPQPELILLDLNLPDLSGVEVCRRLRADAQTAQIPVVMLTARGEEIDRVVGFEVGADDYVVKPFSVRELTLRIRSVLRRTHEPTGKQDDPEDFLYGDLRLNLSAHRVCVAGEEIALTALEFRLLATLAARKGNVQSRERLLADVWEMHPNVTTRTVDTHVKRLRQKLKSAGAYIETLRGVGYRFSEQPAQT